MAKLKLDNGTTLWIKAESTLDGMVSIEVANSAADYLLPGRVWYICIIDTDGTLVLCDGLEGNISPGLRYDNDGAIVVSRR